MPQATKPAVKKTAKAKTGKGKAVVKSAKRHTGGSQASDNVVSSMSSNAFARLDSLFTDRIQTTARGGGARATPKPRKAVKPKRTRTGAKKPKVIGGAGSSASNAVLANMTPAAYQEINAHMNGVAPEAQLGGGASKKAKVNKNKSDKPNKATKAQGKAKAGKGKGKGKARITKTAKRRMKGGSGTIDGTCANSGTNLFHTKEDASMTPALPMASETRFSTCAFKDVLTAAPTSLGPYTPYQYLPTSDASLFSL